MVLVDFFFITWLLKELLNLPQRASLTGLPRKQPERTVRKETGTTHSKSSPRLSLVTVVCQFIALFKVLFLNIFEHHADV